MLPLAELLVKKELPTPPLALAIVPPLIVQVELVTGTTKVKAVVTANVWPLSIVSEVLVVELTEVPDSVSDPSSTRIEGTLCGAVGFRV